MSDEAVFSFHTFEFAVALTLGIAVAYIIEAVAGLTFATATAAVVVGVVVALLFLRLQEAIRAAPGSFRLHLGRCAFAYVLAGLVALGLLNPMRTDYWKFVYLLAPGGLVSVGAILGDALGSLVPRGRGRAAS